MLAQILMSALPGHHVALADHVPTQMAVTLVLVTLDVQKRALALYLKLAQKLMNVQQLLASVVLVPVLTTHQDLTLANVNQEQVEVVKLQPVQISMSVPPEHLVALVVHVQTQLVVTVVLVILDIK